VHGLDGATCIQLLACGASAAEHLVRPKVLGVVTDRVLDLIRLESGRRELDLRQHPSTGLVHEPVHQPHHQVPTVRGLGCLPEDQTQDVPDELLMGDLPVTGREERLQDEAVGLVVCQSLVSDDAEDVVGVELGHENLLVGLVYSARCHLHVNEELVLGESSGEDLRNHLVCLVEGDSPLGTEDLDGTKHIHEVDWNHAELRVEKSLELFVGHSYLLQSVYHSMDSMHGRLNTCRSVAALIFSS